jgi:hypothetical protein
MYNLNEVLPTTSAFIVKSGSTVRVTIIDDESGNVVDTISNTLPQSFYFESNEKETFIIEKCGCCENKIFSFSDLNGNLISVDLIDVYQMSLNQNLAA